MLAETAVPRCPQFSRGPDDVIGCGSTNVAWDKSDKVFDCLDCDIWFSRAQAFDERGPE